VSADDRPDLRLELPASLIVLVFVLALCFHAAGVVINGPLGLDGEPSMFNEPAMVAIWLAALGLLLWSVRRPVGEPSRPPSLPDHHPACAHCFVPYVEGAHFCPTCSRPLTWFSGTGEYEQIYAQAWVLGKASHHPTRWSHVWVLTFLAVNACVAPLLMFRHLVDPWLGQEQPYGAGTPPLILFSLGALSLLNAFIWVALATRSWRVWNLRHTDSTLREPESTYGSPPWWTFDEHWRVPLAESDEDDDLPEPDESPPAESP